MTPATPAKPSATPAKQNGPEITRFGPWPALPWHSPFGHLMDTLWRGAEDHTTPAAEVAETDTAFVVEADLPGVAREDITIDVTGRRLLVHASRTEKERSGMLRHTTRTTGEFALELVLPAPIDDAGVTATLDAGVLTVTLPKTSAAKTTRIPIS